MLTIGTRGSKLALAQAEWVRNSVLGRFPQATVQIKIIKTAADQDQTSSIRGGSATGVWVKEIEESLIAKEIDVAVHSMKDVPTRIPETLEIRVIPVREDAHDALITFGPARSIPDLPQGAIVGTGSIRRQSQLLALRSDLKVMDIRGNVDTRLQKLKGGKYDAIVLACAGLNRLGLSEHITSSIRFQEMLPAPGQGALALETRKDDLQSSNWMAFMHHSPTATSIVAERAFLRTMGGGCNSPIAVHATLERGIVRIEGLVAAPDGSRILREVVSEEPRLSEEAAMRLADRLLDAGGRELVEAAR